MSSSDNRSLKSNRPFNWRPLVVVVVLPERDPSYHYQGRNGMPASELTIDGLTCSRVAVDCDGLEVLWDTFAY